MPEHAIRVHHTGGPEALSYDAVELPPPAPGEVRLRQEIVGVNFIDVYHRSGVYPLPQLPHGIGSEAAGVIEAVGRGVSPWKAGDRVAYAGGVPGAYATRRNVPAGRLVRIPTEVSFETAAASLLKGMTVEYLIRRTFAVQPGMTVLWHAAAGGVGLLACQWLAHLGVTVIGTVGSDEKGAIAKAHGCTHVVNYNREDFAARVREITGGAGVPVAYDSVGRSTFDGSLRSLARRGTMVTFGNASGKPDPFDPLVLSQRGSLYLTRPVLADYTATAEDLMASAAALFDVIGRGVVKVEISSRHALADAAAAHRALESRKTTGSTVLIP